MMAIRGMVCIGLLAGLQSVALAQSAPQYDFLTVLGNEVEGSSSSMPVQFGNADVGGIATQRLLTVHAQSATNAQSFARVSSRLDLSSLVPFVDRISLRYQVQVGGLTDLTGDGILLRQFNIEYFTPDFSERSGFIGTAFVQSLNGVTTRSNSVDRLTNDGSSPFLRRFDGNFTFNLSINPLLTPIVTLQVSTVCLLQPDLADFATPSFCTNSLGVRSTSMTTTAAGVAGPQAFSLAMSVPEPDTWALLIAGFGLVGGVARMRRPIAPHTT